MKLKFSIVCSFCSALFSARGRSLDSTGTPQREDERIGRVENGLILLDENKRTGTAKLADRMQFYKVPGVSVAVISGGKLQWARGYGLLEVGKNTPITTETLFQACSITKPVIAVGVPRAGPTEKT